MQGSRLAVAAVVLGGLLAACSDSNPPNPYPQTPGAGNTPPTLAPEAMVLRPNQLPKYARTDDSTVSAGTLADQENDQSLAAVLKQQGLQIGARATYADPNRGAPPTPFATVISQVLFFTNSTGAGSFFTDELKRRDTAPSGGAIATLSLPAGGTDAISGLAVTVPADTAGDPPSRALFALIRKGRYVAEVLGGGPATTATDAEFLTLVTDQEQQLLQTLSG